MQPGRFRFDDFVLDPRDRQLSCDGTPVELNARYLDALVLLVGEAGRLVSKDRFMDEVWRGVPVTDEALTQCVKTLRRQLGDDAARPRFIETVPKHGYRFVAPVEWIEEAPSSKAAADSLPPAEPYWRRLLLLGGAGVIGAGAAGAIGGLVYGLAAASQPAEAGAAAISVLLVLLCLTLFAALIGGIGVSFGIAAAGIERGRFRPWAILGGALGGLIVGAIAKLLGLDAFNLLFGRSPGDITGAAEGALLGGAIGLGAWLGGRPGETLRFRRCVLSAGGAGGLAGLVIPLLGGRMMGGSLELLAQAFPQSRLRLDAIGSLFGERGFGPVSEAVTGALEGALFGGCIVGAMILARRSMAANR